jgi:hypothetical protein
LIRTGDISIPFSVLRHDITQRDVAIGGVFIVHAQVDGRKMVRVVADLDIVL